MDSTKKHAQKTDRTITFHPQYYSLLLTPCEVRVMAPDLTGGKPSSLVSGAFWEDFIDSSTCFIPLDQSYKIHYEMHKRLHVQINFEIRF